MSLVRSKFLSIVPALYMLAVIVCILLAFDFTGRVHSEWTLVVIGLTLPWSIISVFFMWALVHGAGLELFTVMYLAFAGINAFILYLICSKVRKHYEKKTIG